MNPKYLTLALLSLLLGVCPNVLQAQIAGSDDFNDNSQDPARWNTDIIIGNGALLETNQRLEYRVTSPDLIDGDEADRAWILNLPRATDDWEVVLEVTNNVGPTIVEQIATIGLEIVNAGDFLDFAYVEMYASAEGGLPYRRGFKASVAADDVDLNDATTGRADEVVGNAQTFGALHFVFNGTAKVLSAAFDSDGVANGYQWNQLGSFGVAGSGGSVTNANWGLTSASTFYVVVYGFSHGLTITTGQVHGDNFSAQTVAATPPALLADRFSNSLRLRWPQTALAFQLESRSSLVPATWSAITNVPTALGGMNTLLLPLDTPMQFFRLRR